MKTKKTKESVSKQIFQGLFGLIIASLVVLSSTAPAPTFPGLAAAGTAGIIIDATGNNIWKISLQSYYHCNHFQEWLCQVQALLSSQPVLLLLERSCWPRKLCWLPILPAKLANLTQNHQRRPIATTTGDNLELVGWRNSSIQNVTKNAITTTFCNVISHF